LRPSVLAAQADPLRVAYDEFKPLYDAHKIVVVDTRGEDAYAVGHIPGALVVSLDTLEARIPELKKLKKPIVTYCS
jgi:rhodanese-related sulfurtransferase